MMEVTVKAWGNSAGLRLPSSVLKQMHINLGDTLTMAVTEAGLLLKPVEQKPRYTLAELIAQCDLNASEPADMAAWHAMQPVGREA